MQRIREPEAFESLQNQSQQLGLLQSKVDSSKPCQKGEHRGTRFQSLHYWKLWHEGPWWIYFHTQKY